MTECSDDMQTRHYSASLSSGAVATGCCRGVGRMEHLFEFTILQVGCLLRQQPVAQSVLNFISCLDWLAG